MSLPTTGDGNKPAQPSIRSFFQSKTPQYAPPPSTLKATAPPPSKTETTPPPPAAKITTPSESPSLPTPPSIIPPLPPILPTEATIRPPTNTDITPLKRINALLLPVSYNDELYAATVAPSAAYLSRVILYQHAPEEEAKVVGGVICALENIPSGGYTLYIRSLCVLSPYRGLGLVGMAVENIVNTVRLLEGEEVKTVTAHVWSENEEGLEWYSKQGFQQKQKVEQYYRKLRPDSAYLVSRDIDANTPLSPSSTKTVSATATAAAVNLPPMGSGPPKRPPPRTAGSGKSYMEQKTEMEWNDLPTDMAPVPKKNGLSEPVSAASSRSSSAAPKKKRDRSYPAAAFGKQ